VPLAGIRYARRASAGMLAQLAVVLLLYQLASNLGDSDAQQFGILVVLNDSLALKAEEEVLLVAILERIEAGLLLFIVQLALLILVESGGDKILARTHCAIAVQIEGRVRPELVLPRLQQLSLCGAPLAWSARGSPALWQSYI